MNNLKCSISDREQTRIDYADQFLLDYAMQVCNTGQDPRNRIGQQCGISAGRTIMLHHDKRLESCHA